MATTKPRVTVTLERRTYECLSRLSAVGGDSMSSIISEFIEISLPSMERLVVVLERAKAAPEETRAGIAAAVDRAERDMLPAMMEALNQNDLFLADIESAASPSPRAAQRRAKAGGAPPLAKRSASVDPRLVTRGSGRVGRPKTSSRERGR